MKNSYRLRVRNYAFLDAKTVNTRGFSLKTKEGITLSVFCTIYSLKITQDASLKSCHSNLYKTTKSGN